MTDTLIQDYISDDDLLKFEDKYDSESKLGSVSTTTQFEYGWCLIRSRYKDEIRKGVNLLEGLCNTDMDARDFIFFIGIGYYKLAEYSKALKYVKRLLGIEPNNHQAKDLERSIEKKMKSDALMGMALTGGILAGGVIGVLGSVTYLGFKFLTKK